MNLINEGTKVVQEHGIHEAIIQGKGYLQKKLSKEILQRGTVSTHELTQTWTQVNDKKNEIFYEHVANPYRMIKLHPNEIQFRTTSTSIPKPKYGGLGQIETGKFDQPSELMRLEEQWKVLGIKQRFEHGKTWEETAYYQTRVSRGQSEEKILKKCEKVEEIYNSMLEKGYETHTHLKEGLEVLVVIGREGDIYLRDGHHRYAIAEILDEPICAHVVCRHRSWQKFREAVGNQEVCLDDLNSGLVTHPDLQDVLR